MISGVGGTRLGVCLRDAWRIIAWRGISFLLPGLPFTDDDDDDDDDDADADDDDYVQSLCRCCCC